MQKAWLPLQGITYRGEPRRALGQQQVGDVCPLTMVLVMFPYSLPVGAVVSCDGHKHDAEEHQQGPQCFLQGSPDM